MTKRDKHTGLPRDQVTPADKIEATLIRCSPMKKPVKFAQYEIRNGKHLVGSLSPDLEECLGRPPNVRINPRNIRKFKKLQYWIDPISDQTVALVSKRICSKLIKKGGE